MGLPGWLSGKEPACDAEDAGDAMGLILRPGRSPGGGHGNPLQYSCLGESHGQRSLAGYSPWGHTELDMTNTTEHADTHSNPGLLALGSALSHHTSEWDKHHERTKLVTMFLALVRAAHPTFLICLHPLSVTGARPGFHGILCPFYRE